MTQRKRYNDRRWRRVRAKYLSDHPVCEATGCNEQATDVHHVDELGLEGPAAYKPANLQALCHPCHSRITATTRPDAWGKRPSRKRPPERHPGLIDP